MNIAPLILILISTGLSIYSYMITPYDCLYNGGVIYDTCNKSRPGILCSHGSCYKTACSILNKCPEVHMVNENPWTISKVQPIAILFSGQLACLILLLILNIINCAT